MNENEKITLIKWVAGISSMGVYWLLWTYGGELVANMFLMAIVMGAYLEA